VLLAFDTATPQVTVALHDGDDVVAEVVSDRTMKHGEQLAPLISDVLAEAGVVRQDLTAIAVGAGPGPFTGLRVGLVTARTLGFALEIPVYAACTLDVMAVEAVVSTSSATKDIEGGFFVATDARRKEVYLASYDPDGVRLEGPVVARPADVATSVPVVGEGALLYPDAFPMPIGPVRPSAGWLARAVAEERVELMDPEPLYLRRPDAVEQAAQKKVQKRVSQ
jgi:tRNA threonylcarbamoyl adenosine modification protein YeaZ